jgi:hypothetical protein
MAGQRHIITLCHGPAALLAAGVDEADGGSLFRGYRICAFPDAMDRQTPEIGYMPGQLRWFFGERLAQQGVQIVNEGIDGSVLQDRLLLTGDSPLAGNALGKLAAYAARRTGGALNHACAGARCWNWNRRGHCPRWAACCAPPPHPGLRSTAGVRHRTGLERDAQRVYWIEGDWFGDGSDTDLARYLHACPVNRHVLDSNAPFFWSKRQACAANAIRW